MREEQPPGAQNEDDLVCAGLIEQYRNWKVANTKDLDMVKNFLLLMCRCSKIAPAGCILYVGNDINLQDHRYGASLGGTKMS
jgi:hypothetical protein